jgi:hypothetical protein
VEWLAAGRDCVWQWIVGGLPGEILLAGVEPDERTAAPGRWIAKRVAQHRVSGFESVEHLALRGPATDVELELAPDVRQRAKVLWESDADQCAPPARVRGYRRDDGVG